jgi:hypothetical protein
MKRAVVASILVVVGCVVTLVGPLQASPRDAASQAMTCKEIDAWLESHQDVLPATYDDFVAYPPAFRKRMFGSLSPGVQAGLWRTQFTRALVSETDLTIEQRAVLTAFIKRLGARSMVTKQFPVTVEDVHAAFPDAAMVRRLFYQLGTDSSRLVDRGHEADLITICSCRADWWYVNDCGGAIECVLSVPEDCTPRSSGCGFLGLWRCDGLCCPQGAGLCY